MNEHAHPTTISIKAIPTARSATDSQAEHFVDHRTTLAPHRIDPAQRVSAETSSKPLSLDLRLPLTNIGATLEGMRNGDFGTLSPTQIDTIESLLDDCDTMQSLLHQTIRPDRSVGASVPNAIRQATQRFMIRRSVTSSTESLLAPRRIELLWDGAEDASVSVFADGEALARLLSALVRRAAHCSRDESTILVRIEDDPDRGVVRWSVIDAGCGWTLQQLQQLSESGSFTSVIDEESSADWLLCRQLATW